jgi:hypothetical protein
VSARRWPIYTMKVGSTFVLDKPTWSLRSRLHTRANAHGMRLKMDRVLKHDPDSPVVVRRVA